jgi:hypothetical protein
MYIYQALGNKKAVITLAIGLKYEKLFKDFCEPGLIEYCKRFDYDLICLTTPLDDAERAKNRSPAWQKLLILSQPWSRDYERIVWLDTDIIVNNNNAQDIAKDVPIEKIGAIDQYSIPSRELYQIAFKRFYLSHHGEIPEINNLSPASYYANNNLICEQPLTQVVQTGVMVASPKHHREIFEYTYNNYEDISDSLHSQSQFEMPALSYELIRKDLVHWLPNQFNFDVISNLLTYYPFLVPSHKKPSTHFLARQFKNDDGDYSREMRVCLDSIYNLAIFMHFNGCHDFMKKMGKN